jgi:aspartate/methionine/tyrosine aminotransferase
MSESPELSRTARAIRASVFADLLPRIEARARAGGDLVELHIGDSYRAPPEAARFARVEVHEGDPSLYRYGAVTGIGELRRAFAERLLACGFGPPSVEPESEVLVGAGATHALFCAARAVLDPGDRVLVAAPYWPLSVGVLRSAGAEPVEVPITTRLYKDPSADAAALFERALTPRTRALYLVTPNNPDGKVLSATQLNGIARLAAARDLWILADEVYADHVYKGKGDAGDPRVHTSIARLEGARERTLTIYSLSKSHALAGVRVGFAVGPAQAIAVARRVGTHTVFNVPGAAQRLALAALREPAAWLDGVRRDFREARDLTVGALAGCGATIFPPDGGSYVFLDFAPILRGRPLGVLLERAIDRGVLLAPGDGFGEAFATWARLCFTSVPRERLVQGLERLRDAIADLDR